MNAQNADPAAMAAMQSPDVQAAMAQDQLNQMRSGAVEASNVIGLAADISIFLFPPAAPVLGMVSWGALLPLVLCNLALSQRLETAWGPPLACWLQKIFIFPLKQVRS